MTKPCDGYPVLPAQSLPAAGAIAAALVRGQPLALWRSTSGAVQAWEDRCPHRGVALSLGRMLGDRLACAYHGWEYAQDTGRCVAIPALPHQPVPGAVCVKTYAVIERQGMVWVALTDDAAALPVDLPDPVGHHFLRSMAVAAPLTAVESALAAHGFTPAGPCQWRGDWCGHTVQLWTLDAAAHWCLLHVATDAPPSEQHSASLFGAVRRLRDLLQIPAA